MEDDLRESESRFRNLVETTSDWIWEVDENAVYTYASPQIYHILGYKPEEVIGKTPFDLMSPDEAKRVAGIFGPIVLAKKPLSNFENTNLHKDGHSVVLETSGVPVIAPDGKLRGYRGIDRDITERKKIEDLLRSQEAEWRNTFDSISDFVSIHDKDFHIVRANKALADFLKMTPEEIAGKHCYELLHGTTEPWSTCPHVVTLQSGRSETREVDDPRIGRSLLVSTSPIFDEKGKMTGSVHIAKDITERKRAEEKLRESEQRFMQLFMDVSIPLGFANKDGIILYFNVKFTEAFGYTVDDIPTLKKWWETAYPDESYRRWVLDTWNIAVAKSVQEGKDIESVEYKVTCKNGTERIVIIGGHLSQGGVIATFNDITERKRAEEERERLVKETERINKELNDFAYIVSHDLKAPLRAISQLAEWLNEDYADTLDDAGKEKLELLKKRAFRMHGMIEGILQYSRAGRMKGEPQKVDTGMVVRHIIDSLAPSQNIRITIHDSLPTIVIDPHQINQVFQNLISNAIKYMDKLEGVIEVGCIDTREFYEFFVKDNGPGIEERHFERIFQIFQTLTPKDTFESTGIGLTIVKKIIGQNGGRIWVESEVGKGSTFKFTVPKNITPPTSSPPL